jgi:hypothetical protein
MAEDSDLIAAIYDAVIDPSGWEGIVKRIVKATKSAAGGIIIQLEVRHICLPCATSILFMPTQ